MLEYHEPLFRPPSEASSLILQLTLGCSHNACTFCSMYRTKRFRVRPQQEVLQEIAHARNLLGDEVTRVFLADGDAMCLSPRRLLPLLRALSSSFGRLQRVSAYANARDVLAKSDEELRALRQTGLRLLYLGLESGDPLTLERVHKGATTEQMVQAVQRATAAGMRTSVMVLIGLAGRQRSLEHARASARVLNQMQPSYTALLTYMPTPGSELHDEVARGELELPDALESLLEIRELLQGLRCNTYFTCNHASNYLPLRGRLPSAQPRLLALLDGALAGQVPIKPEGLRGL